VLSEQAYTHQRRIDLIHTDGSFWLHRKFHGGLGTVAAVAVLVVEVVTVGWMKMMMAVIMMATILVAMVARGYGTSWWSQWVGPSYQREI
jgi:hypothetical protein